MYYKSVYNNSWYYLLISVEGDMCYTYCTNIYQNNIYDFTVYIDHLQPILDDDVPEVIKNRFMSHKLENL